MSNGTLVSTPRYKVYKIQYTKIQTQIYLGMDMSTVLGANIRETIPSLGLISFYKVRNLDK